VAKPAAVGNSLVVIIPTHLLTTCFGVALAPHATRRHLEAALGAFPKVMCLLLRWATVMG